jgi:hypothetical protein
VFNKSLPWQIYLNYLDFDINKKVPNKIILNNFASLIGNVNIGFNIPSSQVSKYIIRKYTDKNTCSYKELPSTNTLLSNKNTGDTVNYEYPITTRKNFSGDTTNLTTNCSIENYKYIQYKNINNYYDKYDDYAKIPVLNKTNQENYIFTIRSINDVGESLPSDPTNDILPIVESQIKSQLEPETFFEINKKYIIGGIITILLVAILLVAIWYFKKNK